MYRSPDALGCRRHRERASSWQVGGVSGDTGASSLRKMLPRTPNAPHTFTGPIPARKVHETTRWHTRDGSALDQRPRAALTLHQRNQRNQPSPQDPLTSSFLRRSPPPPLPTSHLQHRIRPRTYLDHETGVAVPSPVRVAAGVGLTPPNGVVAGRNSGNAGGAVADATDVHWAVHVRAGAVEGSIEVALDVVRSIAARLSVDLHTPLRVPVDLPGVCVVRDDPVCVGPGLPKRACQHDRTGRVGAVCPTVLQAKSKGGGERRPVGEHAGVRIQALRDMTARSAPAAQAVERPGTPSPSQACLTGGRLIPTSHCWELIIFPPSRAASAVMLVVATVI